LAGIELKNLTIDFPIYGSNGRSIKNVAFSALTGGRIAKGARDISVVRALSGINMNIRDGDRVGLIGHNGSGKTTLLRVMAGVYEPSLGSINVEGSVISMLSIAQGMSADLTGRQNITLRMAFLGQSKETTKALTDEIIEFSELGDFINMPIRTYSSGMYMRLAFSIVTSINADILLMDEWLSVGDASFSEKARERLDHMLSGAKILVIASHNPGLIDSLCNKKYFLDHGEMTEQT
jgi:lipopolysaccharide transport system ATP-binding protein